MAIEFGGQTQMLVEKLKAYHSPIKRSPTACVCFMSCLAQSAIPVPVAARPFTEHSALMALWLEQVLRYRVSQQHIYLKDNEKNLLDN